MDSVSFYYLFSSLVSSSGILSSGASFDITSTFALLATAIASSICKLCISNLAVSIPKSDNLITSSSFLRRDKSTLK